MVTDVQSEALTERANGQEESSNVPDISISLEKLSLSFHLPDRSIVKVLEDVTFCVARGEFVSIIGPSGCGKSTILDLISRSIEYSGTDGSVTGTVTTRRLNERKPLGYVFQKDTLLPWRTLLQNVCFGLQLQGAGTTEQEVVARSFIDRAGLKGFEDHFPHQLSGGMRQRANVIRTLAYDPEIVLMDEPFGALDAHTKISLQQQLMDLWKGSGKTVLFVTHDLEEAILLSSKVILLSPRPATVRGVYPVDIPYPRSIAQLKLARSFHELYDRLWRDFCEGIGWL